MALTGNEFFKQINKSIDIAPEDFYPEVRDYITKGINDILKYDIQLRKRLEKYVNSMPGHMVNKEYVKALEENVDFVAKLSGRQYREHTLYINASQPEKDYIEELIKKLNEFITILRYTEEPKPVEKEEPERIGYDEKKGENINLKEEETPFQRTTNFNTNI